MNSKQAVLKLQALDTLAAASFEPHSATSKSSTSAFAASSAHESGLTAVAGLTKAGLTAKQADASALLKGRAPQPQDWVDALASAPSTTGYLKQPRVRQKIARPA